jgi:hypothetical protein
LIEATVDLRYKSFGENKLECLYLSDIFCVVYYL